jgi:hypothetical protein
MKDRNENQFEGIKLPPTWCGSLCRNAMNEVCIEDCAIKRDCSAFEEKPNLRLTDMPRFPETKHMTKEEKFTSVTVYLSKVVDHLQGQEDEDTIYPPTRRSDFQSARSSLRPENPKVQDFLANLVETNSGGLDKEDE